MAKPINKLVVLRQEMVAAERAWAPAFNAMTKEEERIWKLDEKVGKEIARKVAAYEAKLMKSHEKKMKRLNKGLERLEKTEDRLGNALYDAEERYFNANPVARRGGKGKKKGGKGGR